MGPLFLIIAKWPTAGVSFPLLYSEMLSVPLYIVGKWCWYSNADTGLFRVLHNYDPRRRNLLKQNPPTESETT